LDTPRSNVTLRIWSVLRPEGLMSVSLIVLRSSETRTRHLQRKTAPRFSNPVCARAMDVYIS
jgi:hypothetical protein